MAAQELVLVDTCIWIQFFNRPQSREKLAVDQLLDEDRAALIGPLLTEVLRGFAKKAQADWVASVLRGAHYPSASIRYASGDYWVIVRGEGIRNKDGPGSAQWPANAELLSERPEFSSPEFSRGDQYIYEMAHQTE